MVNISILIICDGNNTTTSSNTKLIHIMIDDNDKRSGRPDSWPSGPGGLTTEGIGYVARSGSALLAHYSIL